MSGERIDVLGVEIVIDYDFATPRRDELERRLTASVSAMHPRLRDALRRIVVPECRNPDGIGAASANGTSRHICLWSNGDTFGFPDMLPETSVKLLEHECAHLLFPTRGAPDVGAWRRAVETDGPDEIGRPFVGLHIEDAYPESEYLVEDWAEAVSCLCEADRTGDPWFRRRYPHRASIIDAVMAASG